MKLKLSRRQLTVVAVVVLALAAFLFSRTAQVDLLVAAGADASLADATGRTAASVAAAQGNAALAAALSAK